MRTVLATPFTPTLDSGRARRTYGIVRALAAHSPVDVVYGAFGAAQPDSAYDAIDGVRLHRVDRPGSIERIPAYLRARLNRVPDDFARGVWPGVTARTAELAGDGESRLIAEGAVAGAALLPLASRRPVIYSAQNLESAFRHRLEESNTGFAALVRFERLLLRRYAECWMASETDIEGARKLAPHSRLRLVPNVVDVAAIEPLPPRAGERSVLFLGDFSYEPNRTALNFLLDEAMPSLWRLASEIKLEVAGKGCEALKPSDPRVEVHGFVPDTRPLYERAGTVAVPLLEGGGSPLKFVEALAHRAPVVATPHAATGLNARPGEHYVEGEPTGEAFAGALLSALDPKLGNVVASAGRELAEREYSIESLEQRLAPQN